MTQSTPSSRLAPTLLVGHALIYAIIIIGLSFVIGEEPQYFAKLIPTLLLPLFAISSGFIGAAIRRQ